MDPMQWMGAVRMFLFVNCAWSVHIALLIPIRHLFLLEKAILYRGHNSLYLKNIPWWIIFFLLLCILDYLDYYCDVFISCLDSHSDGTHSLQRMHWSASDVMLNFSKSVLMKKQTHLHLEWPEGEYIVIKFSFLVEPFLQSLKLRRTTQGVLICHFSNNQDFRDKRGEGRGIADIKGGTQAI